MTDFVAARRPSRRLGILVIFRSSWRTARALAACLCCAALLASTSRANSRPWAETAVSVETGLLWQVRDSTPLSYRLVPTQLSWRSKEIFGRAFSSGRLVLRNRLTLIGTWFQQGPESHYIAVAASPSIEWWDQGGIWGTYGGAGGGLGWLDSQGVNGSQGQDFTFNWFARAGFEYHRSRRVRWMAGIMFQHMSNGGQTNPNPGIDALGFTLGWTWSF